MSARFPAHVENELTEPSGNISRYFFQHISCVNLNSIFAHFLLFSAGLQDTLWLHYFAAFQLIYKAIGYASISDGNLIQQLFNV